MGAAIVACVSLDESDREGLIAFLSGRLRVRDAPGLLG
jgi:hypothetical protein